MSKPMNLDRSLFDFQFTRNWFITRNLGTFREYVHPEWSGKPIVYLELGVFEGMSMCWMMQKILTHPDSRAVGIDPWLLTRKLPAEIMEEVMGRAFHNTSFWGPRCELIRGNSAEVLSRMSGRKGWKGIGKDSVDLCMVDGDHHSLGMLDDAIRCLKLVKKGGWLIFDDVENGRKKQDHVKQGLAMFLERHGEAVERVFKHKYVEAFIKK